ncbi:MAG TPA: hypothetical protein VHS55_00775 [Solirubrobacteraceae bacterium]|nr:hypothetical protein [Solirubrobacteraceae bacterium]
MRVGELSSRGVLLAVGAAGLALLIAGCGEGRRDAKEPKGTYPVEVTRVSFPRIQAVARDTRLVLVVRNPGTQTMPNVAVTIDSFYYRSAYPHLAVNKRPVWIVNTGPGAIAKPPVESEEINPPGGGETAFVNTWALGPLAAGHRVRFVWHVTPVKSGRHVVHYTVAAGIDGKSVAQLADGGRPVGRLVARIAPLPPRTHVNPETGEVEKGPNPVSRAEVGAVP